MRLQQFWDLFSEIPGFSVRYPHAPSEADTRRPPLPASATIRPSLNCDEMR